MKIITVTGYKGGIGKSTTAFHLAAYLSDRGRTLLIDGDPNRYKRSRSSLGYLTSVEHELQWKRQELQ